MATTRKSASNSGGGLSVHIQFHHWRGFGFERDLFHWLFILGLVTVLVSRKPLLDRLIAMLREYVSMQRENAARGAYPNKGRPVHRGKK